MTNFKGKEIAVMYSCLSENGYKDLAEKLLNSFNEEQEKFGEVWWEKSDIISGFNTLGCENPTEEQVQEAMDNLAEDKMCDAMIQSGWEYIWSAVEDILQEDDE